MSWCVDKLGDLAETHLGKRLHRAGNKGEYYPYLGNDNIQWGELKLDEIKEIRLTSDELERYRVRPGDLLVCEGGDPGRCAIWDQDDEMYFQMALHRVRPDEKRLDAYWLKYYLMSLKITGALDQFITARTTIKHIPQPALRAMPIRHPDIASQRRIASILMAYDNLIENNRRQIALLEEAAQRLYKEWFVDLRFPNHDGVEIVDGVPSGWVKTTMENVCEAIGGGTPSTKNASYWENGDIPWVTPSDVTGNIGLYLPKTEKQITREGLSHSSAKMLPVGTILMTSRASIGYFAICEQEVCTNQGFISCKPFESYYTWWLLLELQSRVEEMKGVSKGSTFLELGKTTFRRLPLVVPDKATLVHFQNTIQTLFNQMVVLRKQHDAALQARDRLLPKFMSGEIEVEG